MLLLNYVGLRFTVLKRRMGEWIGSEYIVIWVISDKKIAVSIAVL